MECLLMKPKYLLQTLTTLNKMAIAYFINEIEKNGFDLERILNIKSKPDINSIYLEALIEINAEDDSKIDRIFIEYLQTPLTKLIHEFLISNYKMPQMKIAFDDLEEITPFTNIMSKDPESGIKFRMTHGVFFGSKPLKYGIIISCSYHFEQ